MKREPADIGPGDADLVHQAQQGHPEAFVELVARYQDRVYNTCYRLCHDEQDALDLTQTTFLKAWQSLPRFEARSTFFTWLFRIAVNLAFSQRRQHRRRRTLSLADPDDPLRSREPPAPPGQCDVARNLERDETHARVQAALARLDPEFRAAVVLKDIEDLDYATIAGILKVPIGTVKSRIHRGRMMLRELLTQETTEVGQQRA